MSDILSLRVLYGLLDKDPAEDLTPIGDVPTD
jgi:hypothetical protein